MKKTDIINRLIAADGLKDYLEIATPSTGLSFSQVNGENLNRRDRLLYCCPADFIDGEAITYRTGEKTSHELVLAIRAARAGLPTYDIVFVDSHHTMACSATDLAGAWMSLKHGGWMIVHGCSPSSHEPRYFAPEFITGPWYGVTYAAFIDFLFSHRQYASCTVDVDEGCGVFQKRYLVRPELVVSNTEIELAWIATLGDPERRLNFFNSHRSQLLGLVSADEFSARYLGR